MAILSTYEQSWAKFIFCVVNTVIFSAFNFHCYLVPFRFMVRGSWPVSGHPRPRSLCHGPRTRMPTDESQTSDRALVLGDGFLGELGRGIGIGEPFLGE